MLSGISPWMTLPFPQVNHEHHSVRGPYSPKVFSSAGPRLGTQIWSYLQVSTGYNNVLVPLLLGDIRSVQGTAFDLREPVLLGPRLEEVPGPGFDHNFCLCASKDMWKERRAARWVPAQVPAQVQSRPQLSAPYLGCSEL